MADAWDQFPDADQDADPWAQFPDEQKAQQPQQVPQQQPQQPNTWGQAAKNVGEAGLQFGSGIIGGLAGDVSGLGALAYDTVANAVMTPFKGYNPSGYADPTAVRDYVAQALSYQPSNPESLSSQLVSFPGKVIGGSGQYLNEKVTNIGGEGSNPYLGHVAGAAPLAAASLLGIKAARGPRFDARQYGGPASHPVPMVVPGTPAFVPEPTPQEAAVKSAQDLGLKLNPMQAGKGGISRKVAGASGRAQLDRELSMSNAQIVDEAAKKHLGIAPNRQLNQNVLNEVRAQANSAYDAIAKTGTRKTSDSYRADIAKIDDRTGSGSFAGDTPETVTKTLDFYSQVKMFDAKDAVQKIRQLRADASKNIKANEPERNALGYAQRKIADALDEEMTRHVTEQGRSRLADMYKAARVKLAKLNSVEDAIEGTHVSARQLSKQKAAGVPLSGELKLIADAYDSFDTVLQDANKIRDHAIGGLDLAIGLGSSFADPIYAAAALARPAARRILASDTYQRSLARGNQAAPNALARPVVAPAATVTAPRERKAR